MIFDLKVLVAGGKGNSVNALFSLSDTNVGPICFNIKQIFYDYLTLFDDKIRIKPIYALVHITDNNGSIQ